MKEITVKIPNDKINFFMELINHLGIEVTESDIPEKHKSLVRERIANSQSDPERVVNWENAKQTIKV